MSRVDTIIYRDYMNGPLESLSIWSATSVPYPTHARSFFLSLSATVFCYQRTVLPRILEPSMSKMCFTIFGYVLAICALRFIGHRSNGQQWWRVSVRDSIHTYMHACMHAYIHTYMHAYICMIFRIYIHI